MLCGSLTTSLTNTVGGEVEMLVGDADLLGRRLALFLRSQIQKDRAKTLARLFNVSVSTAQRWLDGKPPTIQHFSILHSYWGSGLIKALFPEVFIEFERTVMFQHLELARTFCAAKECSLQVVKRTSKAEIPPPLIK